MLFISQGYENRAQTRESQGCCLSLCLSQTWRAHCEGLLCLISVAKLMHDTLPLAVKSHFSCSPLRATVHFCILFASPYLRKQIGMWGLCVFQTENKNYLLLEKMCWYFFLTWIVIVVLVTAWLPRPAPLPGQHVANEQQKRAARNCFCCLFLPE